MVHAQYLIGVVGTGALIGHVALMVENRAHANAKSSDEREKKFQSIAKMLDTFGACFCLLCLIVIGAWMLAKKA